MSYAVKIRRQAKRKLRSLGRVERCRIAEKILLLGENPDNSERDIKPLAGKNLYRLRVGNWRVIFDRLENVKIIAIEKIKPRGDVYK